MTLASTWATSNSQNPRGKRLPLLHLSLERRVEDVRGRETIYRDLCSVFPGLPHPQREVTVGETSAKAVNSHWRNDTMFCESRVIAVTKCLRRKFKKRKGLCACTVPGSSECGQPALVLVGSRKVWWIRAAYFWMVKWGEESQEVCPLSGTYLLTSKKSLIL